MKEFIVESCSPGIKLEDSLGIANILVHLTKNRLVFTIFKIMERTRTTIVIIFME